MARWKKSGNRCPKCNHETEVLVGTMGDHEGICFFEGCWRCGWVAGFDDEKKATKKERAPSK